MTNLGITTDYLVSLVSELLKQPRETGWLEFKMNLEDPDEIGEYLSALSNTAALDGKSNAYVIWGIRDESKEVVGTTFDPFKVKRGNEELESWLLRSLSPRLHFRFFQVTFQDKPLVLLEIPRAQNKPVQFFGNEWIRIGSYRKKLKDYPEQERQLWRVFDIIPFEEQVALERASSDTVLSLLDYPSYFELLGLSLPVNKEQILERLAEDRMIEAEPSGSWNITNLGAVLFAKNLDSFARLGRKAVRVIVYDGRGRLKTKREQIGRKGYASGFEGLVEFVNAFLPRNEVIGKAIRKDVPMYPEPAIRELIPNALIHQDFSVTGSGPMIEVFDNRMEITNPGSPLVSTDRFLDTPPRSRNEALASFMRRVGICEERGSGVDKVVYETEFYQLPAPLFESVEGSTRVVLFAHKPLKKMDRAERSRACYLHACLRYVERDPMTNSSLRGRFGIEEKNSSMASRIIKEAIEDEWIKPFDENQGKKYAKYLPGWA